MKPAHRPPAKVKRFHRRPQSHRLKEAKAGNDLADSDRVKPARRQLGRVLLLPRQLQERHRLNEANAPAERVCLGNPQDRRVAEHRQLPKAPRREESVAGRVGKGWRRLRRRLRKLAQRPPLPRQRSPLASKEDDVSAA